MPLTILHISTRLILGGSQENTVLSCEGQARLGHDVHLAFGPIYGPEGSLLERVEAFRTEDGRGITCHEVPHLVRDVKPLADVLCYRELRALIREVRPDVIHTHSSKAGILGRAAGWAEVGAYERALARLEKARAARVVESASPTPEQHAPEGAGGPGEEDAEAQGLEATAAVAAAPVGDTPQIDAQPDDVPVTGALALWPEGPPAVIHTIHGPPFHEHLPARRNTIYAKAERFAAARCHRIISVADAMTDQYLERGIGRPEHYETVYSGMEVETYLTPAPGQDRESVRERLGFGEKDFVIGTVARLAELKGHDDVIAAVSPEIRTRRNWKLLWVGDGWWRDRLLDRVHTLGLRDNVITTGLVAQDKVAGLMRAMDVLVHPSYREGLPRTVPQALLCGTPVVASDTDGTPEVCIDRETGLLFPVGDSNALRRAVVWLHDHPEEARAMTERGREMCREMFSAERMVSELERVYASAMEVARRRRP